MTKINKEVVFTAIQRKSTPDFAPISLSQLRKIFESDIVLSINITDEIEETQKDNKNEQ